MIIVFHNNNVRHAFIWTYNKAVLKHMVRQVANS